MRSVAHYVAKWDFFCSFCAISATSYNLFVFGMSTFILTFLLAKLLFVQVRGLQGGKNISRKSAWVTWRLSIGLKVSCVSRVTRNCVKPWKQMISPHKRVREQKVNLRAACHKSSAQQDTKVKSKRHELKKGRVFLGRSAPRRSKL